MSTMPFIFISYSHEDKEWKKVLERHLGVLQREFKVWTDEQIGAGQDWQQQITEALQNASVAILLVSANSLTSNYILNEELVQLLQRRHDEGLRIIPIIIKECAWKAVPWLKPIQVRPRDGRALQATKNARADREFRDLALELVELLKAAGSSDSPAASKPLGEVQDRAIHQASPTATGVESRKQFEQLRRQLDEAAEKNPQLARTFYEVGRQHMTKVRSTAEPTNEYPKSVSKQRIGGSPEITGGFGALVPEDNAKKT
jgi:hypothetical protein